MRVISKKRLREFWEVHPESKGPLNEWYRVASRAVWMSLSSVKKDYPHADLVGRCTIFNIGGNKYRLITRIEYALQRIYIKNVFTHSEYTAGNKEKNGSWFRACKK